VEVFNPLQIQYFADSELLEGVANLSTDSDYNYLVNRVNANRLFLFAVTSFNFQGFFDLPILLSKNKNLTR
jgi:hypothetical protein